MTWVYQALAEAVRTHGVDTAFGLLGDGNLDWSCAFEAAGGQVVQARHEGNAVAMADGAARACGGLGVATVTCGPGLTQTATALATAARAGSSVMVLAGDPPTRPTTARDRAQQMDQAAFADAVGCPLVRVDDTATVHQQVREAVAIAQQGRPVILSCPTDVQRATLTGPDASDDRSPAPPPPAPAAPDPDAVEEIVRRLRHARAPFLLLGRGAMASGAGPAARLVAERVGAPIGTTMPAKGYAADDPAHVDVIGGFGNDAILPLADETDVLLAVGASLSHETLAEGRLFRDATLIHVNLDPRRDVRDWRDELTVLADARTTLEAVAAVWDSQDLAPRIGRRDEQVAARFSVRDRLEPGDPWEPSTGTVDPRAVLAQVSDLLPHDAQLVSAVGHFGSLPPRHIVGRPTHRWLLPYEFGAIGQGLSLGIGAALATGRPTYVFEGDGGALMNLQELDTARRTGARLALFVMNDRALGAEYHQLLREGRDPQIALIEPPSFTAVARGFGVDAVDVSGPDDLASVHDRLASLDAPIVVDVHLDPETRLRSHRWSRGYQRVEPAGAPA